MLRIRIQALQRDDGIVYHMYFHFARGTEVNDLPVVITPAKYLRADILHVPQNFILEFHRQEELPWWAYALVNGRWGMPGANGRMSLMLAIMLRILEINILWQRRRRECGHRKGATGRHLR